MAENRHAHSALIDQVGSALITARFGLTPQHLYNWRTRGIPIRKRIAFAKLCAERGVPTPADFFEDFEIEARAA